MECIIKVFPYHPTKGKIIIGGFTPEASPTRTVLPTDMMLQLITNSIVYHEYSIPPALNEHVLAKMLDSTRREYDYYPSTTNY
jgi:hypothetical protein